MTTPAITPAAVFAAGQWVAQTEIHQPLIARIKRVHAPLFEGDEPAMDLVIYSYKGNKLGRVSEALSGPTQYEPCCPCKNYAVVKKPKFPLQLNLMGEPVSLTCQNPS